VTKQDYGTPRVFIEAVERRFGPLVCAHEVCIVASRGRGIDHIQNKNSPSWFGAHRGAHSVKPAAFFSHVERLARGPYLELFAREQRPGWTCIGDALGTRLERTEAAEG